jgi:hypothetical protein
MLYGEITEATSFGELTRLRGRVVMDLAGVRRINSFGVRELLNFFDHLRRACTLEAERCSTAVVAQLNMLPEFSRRIRVRSILAPLECPGCLHEQEVAIELSTGRAKLPAAICDRCGLAMQLAEPEERYFAFTHDG